MTKGRKKGLYQNVSVFHQNVPSKPELGILHKIKPVVAKVLINS